MPKDPTPAQSEASRCNGRRSKGPRSAEGRERAAWNALRHGLCARRLLLPGESAEEFAELEGRLREELRPEGVLAEELFARILALLWRLRRVVPAERRLLEQQRYHGERKCTGGDLLSRELGEDRILMQVSAYEQRLSRELGRLLGLYAKVAERTREGVDFPGKPPSSGGWETLLRLLVGPSRGA